LEKERLKPEVVSGGGTGSYYFESGSGVYNELQCGSYAFMDADYGRILDKSGKRIDKGEWENALFILTSVMSHAKPDKAICDAGLKAQSVDSGLPFVYGRDDVKYVKCSDEHGVIDDPKGVLKINEKLRRAGALRPDLQCTRLVCRHPQRQGRDRLARIRTRQGILKTGRPVMALLRKADTDRAHREFVP
jgi:D-serine deaminase-like pyridoxal phosphate-dependent protein